MSSLFIAALRLNYECIFENSGQVKYKSKNMLHDFTFFT